VDDVVVSTVAHLSENGSLSAGKPLKTVHPALLDELFGQRLGYQFGTNRTALNVESKNKNEVTVEGVYALSQKLDPATVTDSEFKRVRGTPLTLKPLPGDEMRVAVRVQFADSMADKDHLIRLSPGAVRLMAKAQDELDPTGEPQPRNYFPIGTLEANGTLYLNKVDDPIIVGKGRKAEGGADAPAMVDFVFQVKDTGFAEGSGDKNAPTFKIADGTFIEVKKFARVDLSGKELKPLTNNVPVLAVRRKRLDLDGGPKPPEPGKAAAAAPAQPIAVAPAAPAPAAPAAAAPAAPAPAPAPGAPAPDPNMSKMLGTWESGGGLSYTFRGDGTYSAAQAAVDGKAAKSMDGTWRVTGAEGDKIKVELKAKTGSVSAQEWDTSKIASGDLSRVDKTPAVEFKRKG
jgi:hypothetical protein